jgi:hypothetical protein
VREGIPDERRTVRLLSVTLLLVALLAPASLASAAPAERDRWHDVFEGDVEECGLELYEQGDIRGTFVVNTRGRDQLWFGAARVHGTYTLTNPDTGRSMQLRFTINDEDLDVPPQRRRHRHPHRPARRPVGLDHLRGDPAARRRHVPVRRDLELRDRSVHLHPRLSSAGRFETADRSWCNDVHEFLG